MSFHAAAAVLIIALLASPAVAQSTYYVAPTGQDGNAGTLASPWRTINHARSRVVAGDTVLIRAGTYAEMLFWEGSPRGTSWTQPIRFAAYPNESVTIRPPSGSNFALFLSNAGSGVDNGPRYLIFDRLIFDGVNIQSGAVVKITEYDGKPSSQGGKPAHHIRFTNCRVTQNAPREIQGYLIHGEFVEILGGEIDRIGADTSTTGNAQGVYGAGSDLLVDGVDIHHIQGLGLSNISSLPGVDTHRHIIRNNLVHHNLKGGINEGEGTGHIIANNVVYNNGGAGIDINAWGAGSSDGIKVLNNTVYGHPVGIRVGYLSSNSNTVVRNNIAFGNQSNYENHSSSTIASNNLVGVDPLFVNVGTSDFHLRTGSPAINAGASLTDVLTDRENIARPQGTVYDIGAYEFGGTPDQPPPPPPDPDPDPPPPDPPPPPPPTDDVMKRLDEIKALLTVPVSLCTVTRTNSPSSDGSVTYSIKCPKGSLTFTTSQPVKVSK